MVFFLRNCGVNNPALLVHPGGGFFLYFKSHGSKMGLAISEKLVDVINHYDGILPAPLHAKSSGYN